VALGPHSRAWCDIRSRRPAFYVTGDCIPVVWRYRGGMAVNGTLEKSQRSRTGRSGIDSRACTFALFSGGVSLLIFSALYSVLDIKRWRWWTSPALVFGTNAILAFALSNVITALTDRLHVKLRGGSAATLHQWSYDNLFATWLEPVHASLAYAIVIVILNMALVYPLYRRRIFLRV
jgi:hypothetical protein